MPVLRCALHHHIGAPTPFEAGIGVSSDRAAFEAQIDWLTTHHDVIDLGTLLSGKLPRRPLLLTFDDTFRSTLEAIREVLAPRGLPSVWFINPGILGDDALALDSALSWAEAEAGLAALCAALDLGPRAHLSEVVLGDMAKLNASARQAVKARLIERFGPPDFSARAPLIDAADLADLAGLGVEIGNHTMTHTHCRALTDADTTTEILGARTALEEMSGQTVRSFSVPYGNEADLPPHIATALRDSGHEAIFLVHGRSNRFRPAPDIWYRNSLHSENISRLRREMTILPLARSLKQRLLG